MLSRAAFIIILPLLHDAVSMEFKWNTNLMIEAGEGSKKGQCQSLYERVDLSLGAYYYAYSVKLYFQNS
jgi:hypothetical protein